MKLKSAYSLLLSLFVSTLSVLAETGSETDPYMIESVSDLLKLSEYGMGAEGVGKHFVLTTDLTLSSAWAGIGTYAEQGPTDYFSGIFDGKGHKISNVSFSNGSANTYRGFFNQIDGGTVKNLTVATTGFGTTGLPSGAYGCAAIAGAAYNTTIENCVAEGTITATHNVGGIVVRVRDTKLVNCTNKADVTGSYTKVGGICVLVDKYSTAASLIEGCVNTGAITAKDGADAGRDGVAGIIAYTQGGALTIRNCANEGFVGTKGTVSATAKVDQILAYPYAGTQTLIGNAIDITRAVRNAGKGTTEQTLNSSTGTNLKDYDAHNAFGEGETKMDRIMMETRPYNVFSWTIADDYEEGKPIVATKILIKRTSAQSETGSPFDVNRAPTEFYFQGSQDGKNWVTLVKVVTPNDEKATYWQNDVEKTFAIDPVAYGSYRKYRFVTAASNATSGDTVKMAFQYIKVFGTVGDYGTLSRAAKSVDYFLTGGDRSTLTDIVPTLDSKVELDFAFDADVSGTHCLFAANYSSGFANHFRLFTIDGKWAWFYGPNRVDSTVSVMPYGRYKVVIDGPVVTVNGVEVIGAGEKTKLTGSADCQMALFRSFGNPSEGLNKRNNLLQKGKFYSLKVTDPNGKVTCDLEPVQTPAGVGAVRDKVSGRLFESEKIEFRLVNHFNLSDQEWDVTDDVRSKGVTPTVTLVQGESHATYSHANLFVRGETTKGRALFKDEENVIQYDIPDNYNPGYPIVLSRFALLPCVRDSDFDLKDYDAQRAPSQFKLEASADGETWVELFATEGTGFGPGRFCEGESVTTVGSAKGYRGVIIGIPEEKRGNYRHYRFSTYKTSFTGDWKMGLQEIRFYGFVGGFEPRHEPIEYVESAASGNMYFKTGVVPKACDLTVEMEGEFMNVNHTGCLFCSRESSSNASKSWTLFLQNGGFRFDCGQLGTATTFKPQANKNYKIVARKNKLYVDGELVATTGDGNFVPYSELSLFMSHNNLTGWGNKAMFRLRRCRILDGTGAVLRDYIPVRKTTDDTVGLFDRTTGWLRNFDGTMPVAGPLTDIDFWQRDREVKLVTELEKGRLPRTPLAFAFSGNQRFAAKLYAAFDNSYKGSDVNAWAKVVELGDVVTGVDTFTTETKLMNPECYRLVKFFVCDKMERGVSHTKSYRTDLGGLVMILR